LKINIPPIKCQGIKSKLVEWIIGTVSWDYKGTWIEPFCGSCVVGFNVRPQKAIFCDRNPHIINFYGKINKKEIDHKIVKLFLEQEGELLRRKGIDYYYEVRNRFNEKFDPLDFLFLNRACFNGVIRFNSKGKFNVPSNNKKDRFSRAYITKITNQIKYVSDLCSQNSYEFKVNDFIDTIELASSYDFLYCDPPYIGRHVDYYNSWQENEEIKLFDSLKSKESKFILSTWHHNKYRHNPYIESLWSYKDFNIITKEHYYHVGAKEENRNPIFEALVTNYSIHNIQISEDQYIQLHL